MWVTPSSGDGSHGGLDFASPSGCLCIPCARSCALGWYGLASKIMPPRIGMDALSDGWASPIAAALPVELTAHDSTDSRFSYWYSSAVRNGTVHFKE